MLSFLNLKVCGFFPHAALKISLVLEARAIKKKKALNPGLSLFQIIQQTFPEQGHIVAYKTFIQDPLQARKKRVN